VPHVEPSSDVFRHLIPIECPVCEQKITLLPWTLIAINHTMAPGVACPVSGDPVHLLLVTIPGA
jgi:hypothetical protein